MQAGMGITDGIIQGKISCFRNKFHKHKEKCSEKRKFLEALCLRSGASRIISGCFFLGLTFYIDLCVSSFYYRKERILYDGCKEKNSVFNAINVFAHIRGTVSWLCSKQ